MKRILTAALLGLVGLLAACRSCPLVLIIPHLTFALSESQANELTAAPTDVRTCVDATCWTLQTDAMGNAADTIVSNPIIFDAQTRQLTVSTMVQDGGIAYVLEAKQSSTVSLTASRDGGTLFTHEWSNPEFERTEPLGEGCGVFYQLKAPLTF